VPEIYFSTQKMEALRALSRAVVARTRAARASGGVYLVSVGLLQHVVGTWTWAMLIMRELLSIFARTYRVFQGKDPAAVVAMSAAVCDELMMAVDLAPAMLARLLPYSKVVSAFDASTPGYGIAVRTSCPQNILHELGARVERHGSYTSLTTNELGDAAGVRLLRDARAQEDARQTAEWMN
jgi:hypothetical protein